MILEYWFKYITIKISKNQAYLRNNVARQILIFAIVGWEQGYFIAAITAVFHVLTAYLFNEGANGVLYQTFKAI